MRKCQDCARQLSSQKHSGFGLCVCTCFPFFNISKGYTWQVSGLGVHIVLSTGIRHFPPNLYFKSLFGFFILCILFIFAFSENSKINSFSLLVFGVYLLYNGVRWRQSQNLDHVRENEGYANEVNKNQHKMDPVCIYITSSLKRRIVNTQPERTGTHPTPVCVVGAEGQDYVRC